MSKKKKELIGIGILISTIIVVGVLVLSYIVSMKLIMPERARVMSNPMKKIGLKYEDISFDSDGNKIKGWYIPSEKNKFTVVYSHGYKGNRESSSLTAYDMMKEVHRLGGNFLTFDFSGEGQSQGKIVTVGYREQQDLKNAIKYAKKKSKSPIFLYGISMGASTTVCVASKNPNGVIGAICDSPFSNLKEYLENNLSKWSGLPNFPFMPIIISMEEKIAGLDINKVDPRGYVKNLKIPMLIMHGKGDPKIPYTESIRIANNNKKYISLHIIDNNGHCQSLKKKRKQYLGYFDDFIEKNLKNNYYAHR